MSDMVEFHATYVKWPEMLRPMLARARRLFRRERRRYLVMEFDDGTRRVSGAFTSEADYQLFLGWLRATHNWSFNTGKEYAVAQYLANQADPGYPGPA